MRLGTVLAGERILGSRTLMRPPLHTSKDALAKQIRLLALGIGIAATVGAMPASAALGDSTTWNFNLPATGSQNPPYPTVAGLQLVETVDGVQFTLTPTWNDPPAGRFGANSQIERLDYV